MKMKKESGVLIHPTSFPSPFGVGDLGPGSRIILDFLQEAGQTLLQVLPLGPTGYADAPFSPFSSFAGNPYLLSPEVLLEKGYLQSSDLANYPELGAHRVDYGGIYESKMALLRIAYSRWTLPQDEAFREWFQTNADWLIPYGRFMAWKAGFGGASWQSWPQEVKLLPEAVLPVDFEGEQAFQYFLQWEFENQWQDFRKTAHNKGIKILGDLPLYVAEDSCDVWSRRDLFELDSHGNPMRVAGVPPDLLCPEGQRWGNPLYFWSAHEAEGFNWWNRRVEKLLGWVDEIKIDHFRGLEAYWAVDPQGSGASQGQWVKAPGDKLFSSWAQHLKKPIQECFFAENLGFITPEVDTLLRNKGISGMQIGTFLDWSPGIMKTLAPLPAHDYAYTSTHDTQLLGEWLETLSPEDLSVLGTLDLNRENSSRKLIGDLMTSPCRRVVIQIQDLFGLGGNERMNIPGTLGNWTWRLGPDLIEKLPEAAQFLKAASRSSGRL